MSALINDTSGFNASPAANLDLIDKIQAVIKVENRLTATIEKVEPWLRNRDVVLYQPRVRPIPENMEQADAVLKVARNLSSRTSAPAGWSPAAPVIGFSTPSPMPHQLRGGALAALQLDRTKKILEANKKRQKDLEKAAASKQGEKMDEASERTTTEASQLDNRPTKPRDASSRPQQALQPQRPVRPKQEVSMNLSDSSSDDEDDEMEE